MKIIDDMDERIAMPRRRFIMLVTLAVLIVSFSVVSVLAYHPAQILDNKYSPNMKNVCWQDNVNPKIAYCSPILNQYGFWQDCSGANQQEKFLQ
jgi:hypothetical protein